MDFAISTESEMRLKPVSNLLSIFSRKPVHLQTIIFSGYLFILLQRKQDGDMLWIRITFFALYFEFLATYIVSSVISWTFLNFFLVELNFRSISFFMSGSLYRRSSITIFKSRQQSMHAMSSILYYRSLKKFNK